MPPTRQDDNKRNTLQILRSERSGLGFSFGEVVSQVRHIHSKSQRHINDKKIQEKNTFNSDNVENLDSDL